MKKSKENAVLLPMQGRTKSKPTYAQKKFILER